MVLLTPNDSAFLLRATMPAAHAVCDPDADPASSKCLLDSGLPREVSSRVSGKAVQLLSHNGQGTHDAELRVIALNGVSAQRPSRCSG